jgi:hypothetical protein
LTKWLKYDILCAIRRQQSVKKVILAILLTALCLVCFACSDSDRTVSTLQKAGFTKIRTTGWNAFQCGEGDVYSTGFVATNPQDVQVSGTVCCGWIKACTIRF